MSHIHLNDNAKMPKHGDVNFDKLYKVRPFLNKLNTQFDECYHPSQNQSVDESMIKFKGRSALKQYMPMKPTKRGYKVWVRADDKGYVCQFDIYTGKKTKDSKPTKDLGPSVVKELTSKLEGKFFKIYADNFFSSIPLAKYLSEKGIGYCGTIRSNRKHIPDLTKDAGMKQGDSDWRMEPNGVSVTKWMDNKAVHFISNMHNPLEEKQTTRRQKDGTMRQVPGRKVGSDYNKNMGFVDKADMLRALYQCDRKSRKWWHRIFFYFLDVTLVNAYVISCNLNEDKNTLKKFKISVVHGLAGTAGMKSNTCKRLSGESSEVVSPPSKKFKTKIPQEVRLDKADHLPIRIASHRRCNYCSTKKEPHRTIWECSLCKVPLCNNKRGCFAKFHSVGNKN